VKFRRTANTWPKLPMTKQSRWDVQTGQELRPFKEHSGRLSVASSPDGSAGQRWQYKTVKVWRQTDRSSSKSRCRACSLARTENAATLEVWDAETGQELLSSGMAGYDLCQMATAGRHRTK
jgi:hypothetical protein